MKRWSWIIGLVATFASTACSVEEAPSDDDGSDNNAPATEQLEGPVGCLTHSECPAGNLCAFEAASCGQVGGICQPANGTTATPACPATGPICGCDGITYENACLAWDLGVSIWFDATCEAGPPTEPPPPTDVVSCGGGCGGNQFCYFGDNSCGANGGGECRDPNGVCTSPMKTVCGCNGTTYDSECEAMREGTSVAWDGPC
jgi:Kazal-type serine protease inhibitor domain